MTRCAPPAVYRAATRLVPATSAHFLWAREGDESVRSGDGLRLPPGGLESPDVLDWLERTATAVSAAIGDRGAWLIAEGDEVVGMISFKGPPRDGVAEIGYGVAESRRARGHATRAVALVLAEADALGLDLIAETASDHRPSQLVLERHGFRRSGERFDAQDGQLVVWRRQRGVRATCIGQLAD